jgi:hypothetical protein
VGDGISTITEVMCYFAKFEPLYFQGESKVAEKLSLAIIDVYSNILRFLSKAKSYYDERTNNRLSSCNHGLKLCLTLAHLLIVYLDGIAKSVVHSPARYTSILASINSGREKVDMWAKLIQRESEQDLCLKRSVHHLMNPPFSPTGLDGSSQGHRDA